MEVDVSDSLAKLEIIFRNGGATSIVGPRDVLRSIMERLASDEVAMGEIEADGQAFTYLFRGADVSRALLRPAAPGENVSAPAGFFGLPFPN